jgi:hypothetical protein
MTDREKVIKQLENDAIATDTGYVEVPLWLFSEILALLKEQEEKPLRCKTCTMRDKTGFCHRWNIEVKDDDYCSFGAWKGCYI